MKPIRRLAQVFVAFEMAACFWMAFSFSAIEQQVAGWREARPPFTEADVKAAATAATFEAQVLPEPLKSLAYRAIVWTMRNRVASGYEGTIGYSDERLLNQYVSYRDHRDDIPDPLALLSALQVLTALTEDDDPTRGARHYVDNSYWTGTHEQTGTVPRFRGKFSDADVQRLVEERRFSLAIEWKSPLGRPPGPQFYGLYFFDTWPPPMPAVTPKPTGTPTARPTETFERPAGTSPASILLVAVTPTPRAR